MQYTSYNGSAANCVHAEFKKEYVLRCLLKSLLLICQFFLYKCLGTGMNNTKSRCDIFFIGAVGQSSYQSFSCHLRKFSGKTSSYSALPVFPQVSQFLGRCPWQDG